MPDHSAGRVSRSPATSRPHVPDPGLPVRRLANETSLGSIFATSAYGTHLRPVSDPNSRAIGYELSNINTGRTVLGWIMDGTAIANCYRVHLEKGYAPIIATAAVQSSAGCLGVSTINTYTPGTPVIVLLHDKTPEGLILGAVPQFLDLGSRAYHDYISQASRKRVDDVHKRHLKQPASGQLTDFSAWRPYDATLAGEWGGISSTGISITLDDFMAQFSVNESTGIFAFYHDMMLRVAGYNMQVWTAGSVREAFMDQAEYNDTQGYAPYPWEAIGLLTPLEGQTVQQYPPSAYQCALQQPYYAHWENKHEFQQPYHRFQQFHGYLGQGGRSSLSAPPPGLTRWTYEPSQIGDPGKVYESAITSKDIGEAECLEAPINKLTDHEIKPAYGLHADTVGLDGRRAIVSAKGIVLAKRTLIPLPQAIKRPEDIKGGDDAATNYKAAGQYGAGPDHPITGDIAESDDVFPHLQRAAAILDLHAYLFNYSGLHPFYWHAKDYKTWEQSELAEEGYASSNSHIPTFSTLRGSMYLSQPPVKTWKIDHRYGDQKFYEAESFFTMLDDGGIVIGDAYGASITMSGGSIILSAPGDVWVKTGRDMQVWAGGDHIVRAHDAIDLSSTKKSIRLKAEENIMAVAGNSGVNGGILLESRATATTYDFEQCGDDVKFGGVALRAKNSNVVAMGQQTYIRSLNGDLVLDAGAGQKDILTNSASFYNYISRSGAVAHFFGSQAVGGTSKANMFRETITTVCGPFGVDKDVFINGNVLCDGSVLVGKGHILTAAASKGAIQVGPLDGEAQRQIREAVGVFRTLIDVDVPEQGDQIDQAQSAIWYGDKRAGNERTVETMQFSFRTDEQYKLGEDFRVYEDRWQQMALLGGQELKKWEEQGVSSTICDKTYPFPGKKFLVEQEAFIEQELNLVDTLGGGLIDADRGQAPELIGGYATPEFHPNSKTVLNGNYPIIGRNP